MIAVISEQYCITLLNAELLHCLKNRPPTYILACTTPRASYKAVSKNSLKLSFWTVPTGGRTSPWTNQTTNVGVSHAESLRGLAFSGPGQRHERWRFWRWAWELGRRGDEGDWDVWRCAAAVTYSVASAQSIPPSSFNVSGLASSPESSIYRHITNFVCISGWCGWTLEC